MTTISREEICSTIERLIICAEQVRDSDGHIHVHANIAIASGRKVLAALRSPQAESEPVAWRITDGEGGYNLFEDAPGEDDIAWASRYGRKYEPLYAVPRSSPPKRNDALHEIVTNGDWQGDRWCVSRDVYELAYNADLLLREERAA